MTTITDVIKQKFAEADVIRIYDTLLVDLLFVKILHKNRIDLVFKGGLIPEMPKANGMSFKIDQAVEAERNGVKGYIIPTFQCREGVFISFMKTHAI